MAKPPVVFWASQVQETAGETQNWDTYQPLKMGEALWFNLGFNMDLKLVHQEYELVVGTWLLFSPMVGMMIQSEELIFFRGVAILPTSLLCLKILFFPPKEKATG